jgi:sensor c-di-GMP phosphodiesterase-like protein
LATEQAELAIQRHANAARDEMQQLADEFQLLVYEADVRTPVLDILRSHIALEQAPVRLGSRQVPMQWRKVWIGIGILSSLAALLVWLVGGRRRRRAS